MTSRILYLGGGSFAGVFGAGVVTRLEEADVYDEIDMIYAGSAGAMNAAYFLCRQSWLGSTLYWEELPEGFVHPANLLPGTFQRLWNGYISEMDKTQMDDVLDVNFLFEKAVPEKPLDTERLQNQSIPLKTQLLDVEENTVDYIDARTVNSVEVLRAAVTSLPYCSRPYELDGHLYADAMIKDPAPVDYLLEKHPQSHIIFQLNHPTRRSWTHKAKDLVEGFVASQLYTPLYECFAHREERRRQAILKAEQSSRVTLLAMPDTMNGKQFSQDIEALKKKHEKGREVVEERILDASNESIRVGPG